MPVGFHSDDDDGAEQRKWFSNFANVASISEHEFERLLRPHRAVLEYAEAAIDNGFLSEPTTRVARSACTLESDRGEKR